MRALLIVGVIEIGVINDEVIRMGGSLRYDFLSYRLRVLRIFIILLSLVRRKRVIRTSLFYFLNLRLLIVLVFAFCTSSFLGFFFFFESALIPLILVIIG